MKLHAHVHARSRALSCSSSSSKRSYLASLPILVIPITRRSFVFVSLSAPPHLYRLRTYVVVVPRGLARGRERVSRELLEARRRDIEFCSYFVERAQGYGIYIVFGEIIMRFFFLLGRVTQREFIDRWEGFLFFFGNESRLSGLVY